MLKLTKTYTDYNGNQQTEDCYFNLTKVEIAKIQVRQDGNFIDNLRRLAENNHIEEIFDVFCNLVLDSYGQKTEDGKRFIKTPEMRAEFEQSIVYSEIMADLIGDNVRISDFTRKIIPPDLMKQMPSDEELAKALPAGV